MRKLHLEELEPRQLLNGASLSSQPPPALGSPSDSFLTPGVDPSRTAASGGVGLVEAGGSDVGGSRSWPSSTMAPADRDGAGGQVLHPQVRDHVLPANPAPGRPSVVSTPFDVQKPPRVDPAGLEPTSPMVTPVVSPPVDILPPRPPQEASGGTGTTPPAITPVVSTPIDSLPAAPLQPVTSGTGTTTPVAAQVNTPVTNTPATAQSAGNNAVSVAGSAIDIVSPVLAVTVEVAATSHGASSSTVELVIAIVSTTSISPLLPTNDSDVFAGSDSDRGNTKPIVPWSGDPFSIGHETPAAPVDQENANAPPARLDFIKGSSGILAAGTGDPTGFSHGATTAPVDQTNAPAVITPLSAPPPGSGPESPAARPEIQRPGAPTQVLATADLAGTGRGASMNPSPAPRQDNLAGASPLRGDAAGLSAARGTVWAAREDEGALGGSDTSVRAFQASASRYFGPATPTAEAGEFVEVARLLPQSIGSSVLTVLPAFDLSALERGMQHFLGQVEQMGKGLSGTHETTAMYLWIVAATAAATACEMARRQLKGVTDGPEVDMGWLSGSRANHPFGI